MGSQKAVQQKSTDTIIRNSVTRDSSRVIQRSFSHIQQIYRLQRALGNRAVTTLINKRGDLSNNGTHRFPLTTSNLGLISISCFLENKNNTIQEELQRMPEEEETSVQGMVQRKQEDEEEPVRTSLQRKMTDKDEKLQTAIQCSEKEDEEKPVQGKLQCEQEEGEESVQTSLQREMKDKEEELQTAVQRTEKEEDEKPVQGKLQCQKGEDEETVQTSLQREVKDKEEELQTAVQRMEKEEDEKPVQGKLQRQKGEDEETVQTSLQREVKDKEEELQTAKESSEKEDEDKPIQRKLQCKTDEEEPVQGKLQLKSSEDTAIQAKLTVGKPDDIYEKEADRVADRVMTMPAEQTVSLQSEKEEEKVKRSSLSQTLTPFVQREQKPDDKVQASFITIQRKSRSQPKSLDDKTSSMIRNSLGQGSPLPRETADFMESRFGADFSSVKIHTDSQAATISKQINARAFTLGNNIYFGEGQYNSQTHEGKRLLAHELTHTIQQGTSPVCKAFPVLRTAPVIQRWSLKGLINRATGYIPGFSLLCLILGRNPVTDEKVERTPESIVKAILELIPVVGKTLYNKLQETGAIQKTGAWLSSEISKLGITWEGIKSLFKSAWDRMGLLLGIDGNLKILKEAFGPVIGRIVSFAGSVAGKIKEIVLEAALSIAGGAGKTVMGIINKGKAVFEKILDDPIGFVGNFLKAVGQGVGQFGKNFLNHFKGAIFGWLFGAFAKEGIKLPKSIDLASIFGFVAEILGLTYQAIRKKIVKALGPKGEQIISKIESAIDFVKGLITRGPIALWEKVKESVGDLKSMIMTEVGKWVSTTIIGKAIEKIASMCNPVGALIQAAISIYNTIMFFVERWTQIKEFVDAIFNSIKDIAMGNIGKAAGYIEKVMAKGLTLLISFMARLIGLGGIVGKIKDLIKKFAGMIEKALDKAIGWIVKKAKGLLGKIVGFGKKVGKKVKTFFSKKTSFVTEAGENHSIYYEKKGKNATIMISSVPKSIYEFLDWYKKQFEIKDDDSKGKLIENIKGHYKKSIEPLLLQLSVAESLKKEEEQNNIQQKLLLEKVTLTRLLRTLMNSNSKVSNYVQKYALEGLTGTYTSLPKPVDDKFTPDHQPQAAILEWVADQPYFKKSNNMALRAIRRAKNGYAINLHENRHRESRTYGSDGKCKKNEFIESVGKKISTASSNKEKRTIVVGIIKNELEKDVEHMKRVVERSNKNSVWNDIHDLKLPQKEESELIVKIRNTIISGEDQIKNQEIDSLKQ